MLENRWKRRAAAVLAAAACVMMIIPAYASEKSVQVNIPVEAKKAEADIKISASEEGAPMPETTSVHLAAGSKGNLGPITYTEADDYSYTISDGTQSYKVNVQTTYDTKGDLQATVWSVLSDGTKNQGDAFSFGIPAYSVSKDSVPSTASVSSTSNVKTGDIGQAVRWEVMAVAAGITAAGALAYRKRKRIYEVKDNTI